MTKFILFIFDRLKPIFLWAGIDYAQMRNILEVKLMIDARRPQPALQHYNRNEDSNNKFLGVLAYYVLLGFLTGFFIFLTERQAVSTMTFVYAYLMFMIGFTLISDFTELMIDTTDNQILLPRPIDSRTLWAARLAHIASYLILITLANSLGSIVFLAFKFGGVLPLLHLVLCLIAGLSTLIITSFLYLILIRFTSEQRLKDIISYVQIVFTMVMMIGYQMIGKFDMTGSEGDGFLSKWWHFISPPSWYAHLIDAVAFGRINLETFQFLALVIFTPVVGFWLMNKYLAPYFNKKLAGMGAGEGIPEKIQIIEEGKTSSMSLSGFWAKIMTNSPVEKGVFELVWKVIARDRKFQIRTYPSFAILIYFGYKAFRDPRFEAGYYGLLYVTVAMLFAVIGQITFSDDYKAAWVYRVTPLGSPKDALLGGKKAILCKIFFPIYSILLVSMVYFVGWKVLGDVLFSMGVAIIFSMSELFTKKYNLPFSKAIVEQTKASSGPRMLVMLILVLPISIGIHYAIKTYIPFGIWIGTVAVFGLCWFMYQKFDEIDWVAVED